ncbi:hypothetical protein [Desertivirga brevis]|uniref:hypothetical protein n=1 Tax=Desertivirga brevis TaxID=2810310 RepID=UPI001A963619|nr:hypothetical protein [Pedobacter sp. SYSU D00873]
MKRFLLVFFVVASLTACKKDKEEEVDVVVPPPVVSLTRNFIYPADNSTAIITYAGSSVSGKATIADDKSLVISIDTPFPQGNDNVSFVIPQGKIKAGYTGEYVSQPTSPETLINYQYQLTATSANKLLPGAAVGTLKIEKFDATLKTLTGQFSFNINAQSDPTSAAANSRTTTIVVIGNFENLVIK